MGEWLRRSLTTLAFVWRVERGDGVAVGFTSHDRDLVIEGFRYRAAPGMVPSAVRLSEGLDVDDVALDGALSSGAFVEDDLLAGRWDGAALTLSAVDWSDADAAPVSLVRGEFGAIELRQGQFSVGLRGVTAVFDRAAAEETSPACRATLGDKRCRVDLRGRRRAAVVTAVDGAVVTLGAVPAEDGAHDFGTLRWLEGANAGLVARVVGSVGVTLTLAEEPALAVVAPVRVELLEGCDRRFETCVARFANAANFRGEPHLPGNDLLTRYGG